MWMWTPEGPDLWSYSLSCSGPWDGSFSSTTATKELWILCQAFLGSGSVTLLVMDQES